MTSGSLQADAQGPSIRVLHVVPSGVTPPIANVAERIPHTIEAVQRFLDVDVERRLRIEPGVTRVSVSSTNANNLISQLQSRGYNETNTIYLSFADAGSSASGDPCGFASGNHAILLMPVCDIYPGDGPQAWPYNATYLVLHELLHTLGAVPNCAPSYDGTGHANDSNRDVLGSAGPRDWPNLTIDAGRDDYFDHNIRGCTDTADSPFWTTAGPCISGWSDVRASEYFSEAVEWATCTGITSGTSANTFGPRSILTRAQLATLVWRYDGRPVTTAPHGFVDVPAGSYYEQAVAWLTLTGVTTGTSANTFSPADPVTRAQMAALLWRFEGSPAAGAHGFVDVPTGAYYDEAVGWMASRSITTGTSPTLFSPDLALNRAQAVTFLWRLAGEP